MRQFQSESQDYEREINELSHRYKLLNELKDKITQGKDSIMLIYLGWMPRNVKILIFEPKLSFWRQNHKNYNQDEFPDFYEFTL